MLYFPCWHKTDLLSSDQTYASKFYGADVQDIIEQNRAIFEPVADAINEALEAVKNNPSNIQSYDARNDQENSDIQNQVQLDWDTNESFNEQQLSELAPTTQSNQHQSGTITSYNQQSDISVIHYVNLLRH